MRGAVRAPRGQAAERRRDRRRGARLCHARPPVRRQSAQAVCRVRAWTRARYRGLLGRSRAVCRGGFLPRGSTLPGPPDHQARTRSGAVIRGQFLTQARDRWHRAAVVRGLPGRGAWRARLGGIARRGRQCGRRPRNGRGAGRARRGTRLAVRLGRRAAAAARARGARVAVVRAAESTQDRKWLVFFCGLLLLLPVAVGLAFPRVPTEALHASTGFWGDLVATFWRDWFGSFGAWIGVALAGSVLTAATLAWNPIRALVGRRAPIGLPEVAAEAAAPKRKRKRAADDDAAGGE